ncbi:MAG: S9 family peptidase [Bacteroidales bacterium]|nr:S9 family peptidase [Bacteroidales bacterium]
MRLKIFALITLMSFVSILQAQESVLTAEKLWKLGRVSDVNVSPDGSKVLYGVTRYDLDKNSGDRDLYVLDEAAESPRQVTDFKGSEYNGIWRPDGKKIGFIATKGDSPQIWEMNPDGTEKEKITHIEGGVTGFSYAPSMERILFTQKVKLDKSPQDIHPDLPEANVHIANDLMYRHWDEWHDYKYNHIFVAPYNNGEIGESTDIMKGERYDAPKGGSKEIDWSPDGAQIAYNCKKLTGKEFSLSTNSEIYLYDLETEETSNLTENRFKGYDKEPTFSPDGSKLVWWSMETPGFESDKQRIMLYDFNADGYRDLSKGFDQSSSDFHWNKEGDKIYFISGTEATYQIYHYDRDEEAIHQITEGKHNYQEIQTAGDHLVASRMTMAMPTEIYKVDRNGKASQLTFTNKKLLDKIQMGRVKGRWIETTDGKQMLTWIIYPPNFDPNKKYPTLLYAQGGPQSAVSQFFSYRWNFQMMAAHDYIVVAPNRRGLPTFGQEWNDQISGDYGGKNIKDYYAAIDTMAKEKYVDEENLGAVGASYGGYSVFYMAGDHNGRFDTFISHCGMYNFESWYGSTEEYWFPNQDIEGPFWQDPKPESYEFSPHKSVQKWDTPIMMITGGKDFRIPYTQSLEAFNAAQLLGVPSRLLYFPEESHFVLQPQNAVLWQREFFKWLDKWLK